MKIEEFKKMLKQSLGDRYIDGGKIESKQKTKQKPKKLGKL
tara:strand:+ start:1324 stop:1446 length:123 start_codon:yes stop_codon:yes gene_type:complete